MHARHLRAPLVVGLVLLGLLAVAPGSSLAQDPPQVGIGIGITVAGIGEASAPAETARLQLLIVSGDFFGGMPAEELGPDASPAAEEVDMEAALAPIVDALVAEGVDEAAISIVVSPIGGDRFGGGGSAGRLDLSLADPTRESLNALLAAADAAATDQELLLTQVGIAYEMEDCAAIEREARQAAIDDARARAEVQAELLGVQIGPITASTESPYFGPFSESGCGFTDGGSFYSEGFGLPVTLPSYDPGAAPEVEVYVVLSLTFAIAQG
ncbi:MAG: SIMPL domain-containing protein [Thermomicrobiales bacterium]